MDIKASYIQDLDQLDLLCRYGIKQLGLNLSQTLPNAINLEQAILLVDSLEKEDQIQVTIILDNPSDDELHEILSVLDPDRIEIVNCTDKDRIAEISYMTNLPIIQHVRIQQIDDIIMAQEWENIVDYIHLSLENPHIFQDVLDIDFSSFGKPYLLSAHIDPSRAYKVAQEAIGLEAIDIAPSLKDREDLEMLSFLVSELQRARQDQNLFH